MIKISRTARKYLGALYYHTIVQGINKEYIFSEERYMKQYLKLLKKYSIKLNVEIIAFCIMHNHAHFLIQTNDIKELSKLMQQTNSEYARYYNFIKKGRVGYVFRDRFLSEPIVNRNHFIQCIKYIHLNPVKAKIVSRCEDYKYSSYNNFKAVQDYNSNKLYEEFLTKTELSEIIESNETNMNFIDIDNDYEERIQNAIALFKQKENIKLESIFIERKIIKKLVNYLKKEQKIKYVEIMRYFDLTKGTMERLK